MSAKLPVLQVRQVVQVLESIGFRQDVLAAFQRRDGDRHKELVHRRPPQAAGD